MASSPPFIRPIIPKKPSSKSTIIWSAVILTLGLFILDIILLPELSWFGVKDKTVQSIFFKRYWPVIVIEQIKILLSYASLALGFCISVNYFIKTAGLFLKAKVRSKVLALIALGLITHLWCLGYALISRPALYIETLNNYSFCLKILHYLTHHMGLIMWQVIGYIMLGMVVTYGLFQWQRLKPRKFTPALAMLSVILLIIGRPLLNPLYNRLFRSPAVNKTGINLQKPSILILAVDSLRADRILRPEITPHLSALAAQSVYFSSARVSLPRTFPSWITYLTGKYPHEHGIRTMFPTHAQREKIGWALPDYFRQQGYRTGVWSDFAGEIFSRTPLGFQQVHVPHFDAHQMARMLNLRIHFNFLPYAQSWLGQKLFPSQRLMAEANDPLNLATQTNTFINAASTPFFGIVFFSTAHFPYAAQWPYYLKFADAHYKGEFVYHKQPWSKSDAFTPNDKKQIDALYDGAISATDAAIGQILDNLKRTGQLENTVVIVMSDHGENLYDQPQWAMGHGDHLSGPYALTVPWIIYSSYHHLGTRHIKQPVRDIDLAPTLQHLVQLPRIKIDDNLISAQCNKFKADLSGGRGDILTGGVDLTCALLGNAVPELPLFAETGLWFDPKTPGVSSAQRIPYPPLSTLNQVAPDEDIYLSSQYDPLVILAKHRMYQQGKYKLIYQPTLDGPKWHLYDVEKDPAEKYDVASQNDVIFNRMKQQLIKWIKQDSNIQWVEPGYALPSFADLGQSP